MDYTKKQLALARLREACGKLIQKGAAFAIAPVALSDSVATVDPILGTALAGLALFGGLSVGLLYRKTHDQAQALRQRAESAEAELRALLTMTDDAVLLLDGQGKVHAANPAADELFGRDSAEFMGDPLSAILTEQPNLGELTQQGPATFLAKVKRADGAALAVEVLISQVRLQQGASYLALLHEMVDRELKPLPTHSVQDISGPVSKFCHDLNNHLTGVLGNDSLILMAGQTDQATQDRALNAKKTALRAQEISRKLHALARGEDYSTLPPEPTIAPTIVQMPPPPATGSRPRILILDDEEAICSLLSAVLTPLGCDVVEATTPDAAISACGDAVQKNARFDLVITDLSLSDDMDGTAAVAVLKKIDPQIKAIITTGHNADPILLRYREYGFVGALSKPYEIAKIERLVFQVLADPDKQLMTA